MWIIASLPFWMLAALFAGIAAGCGLVAFSVSPTAMDIKREYGGGGTVLLGGIFFMRRHE